MLIANLPVFVHGVLAGLASTLHHSTLFLGIDDLLEFLFQRLRLLLRREGVVVTKAANARKYTSAEDCLQLKFAVLDGSTHETLAKENGFIIMAKGSTENALKAVSDGSADAAIVNSIYASTAIGKGNEFPDLARSFRLKNNKIGFAFRKGSELAQQMNDYFVTAYTSGQMKQMASKYSIQKLITEQVTEQ